MSQPAEWQSRLSDIRRTLRALNASELGRETVETLYGVGRRQAIELMKQFGARQVKGKLIVDRPALLALMDSMASSPGTTPGAIDPAELARRRDFAARFAAIREEWLNKPQFLVEAPESVARAGIDSLPPGVLLEQGRIVIEFDSAYEAAQKMLAVAMAMANGFGAFELAISRRDVAGRIVQHPEQEGVPT